MLASLPISVPSAWCCNKGWAEQGSPALLDLSATHTSFQVTARNISYMACVRAPVRLAGSVMLPITPFCGCSKSMCVDKASLVGYAVGLNTWSTFALLLLPSAMLTPHTYISSTAQGSSVVGFPNLKYHRPLAVQKAFSSISSLGELGVMITHGPGWMSVWALSSDGAYNMGLFSSLSTLQSIFGLSWAGQCLSPLTVWLIFNQSRPLHIALSQG